MAGPAFVTTARSFFDGTVMHGPTSIVVTDGIVTSVAPHAGPCEHEVLCPGLVDLQVNGWADVDFADADQDGLERVDRELASHGTTTYLATLVTDTLERLRRRVDSLAAASTLMPGLAGVHLEGPFLGRAPGAHRVDRIVDVDLAWLGSLPPQVRLVTLAPEQDSAVQATALLSSRGVTVSVGHSRPTEAELERVISSGATMCTHLYNAMSGVHHRDHGLALAVLTDDRVTAGLIADMHHVSAAAVALAFRAKPGRVCLVSDSVGWLTERSRARGIVEQDGAPRLPDGTLAGSSTTLAECVRRSVVEAGVGLAEALRAATSVPAGLIGDTSVGTVSVGRSCDIVALDGQLRVTRTWRRLVSSRGNPSDS